MSLATGLWALRTWLLGKTATCLYQPYTTRSCGECPSRQHGLPCLLVLRLSPGERDASPNKSLAQVYSASGAGADSVFRKHQAAQPVITQESHTSPRCLRSSLGCAYYPASTPPLPARLHFPSTGLHLSPVSTPSTSSVFPLYQPWLWF